jgi:hypothetical protein
VAEEKPVTLGITVDITDPSQNGNDLQDLVIVDAPTGAGYFVNVAITDKQGNSSPSIAASVNNNLWEADVAKYATSGKVYTVTATAVLVQNDAVTDSGICVRVNCRRQ